MHRVFDACFASYVVTADQFVLLARLMEQDGITQKDLAQRACSDPSRIRSMLALLEGRGFVICEPDPTDGRARRVTLTQKGPHAFQRHLAIREPIRSQLLDGFSADEDRVLIDRLRRLGRNLAAIKGLGHRAISSLTSTLDSDE
jgi:DNA-binding MarR family transcriptional regulator